MLVSNAWSGFRRVIVPALLLQFVAFISNPAYAANFKIPTNSSVTFASLAQSDQVEFSVERDRSYCVEGSAPTGILFYSNAALNSSGGGIVFETTERGSAYPGLNGSNPAGTVSKSRICGIITAPSSLSANGIVFRATVGAAITNATARGVETTLFGGFNTSITDFNFLELTNVTQANGSLDTGVVTGTIIAVDAITDEEKLRQNFTINPGDRIDVNIHDAVGAGAFGPIRVIHNGVPGALKGVVSQYRIVTTSPLDFEPVSQLPLTTFVGQ